jgi:uncharacterized protein YndB with AHSA1/START domain
MDQGPSQKSPELRISRSYPVPPEKVWRAWTDPQALSRWFGPGDPNSVTRARLDVQAGGEFDIAFRMPDGQEHNVGGVYQEVVPLRKLVFTWAWKSTPERVSLVTVELAPVAGGTQLDFLHTRFFDAESATNHGRGWTATFVKLDAALASAT